MIYSVENLVLYAPLLAAMLLLGALITWLIIRRGAETRQLRKVIKIIASEYRTGLVIPDGMDGEIQLQHVLLTPVGILVMDLKRANGPVFAGEKLETWTVKEGPQRYKFGNPLGDLRARTAAVRALAKDVPVHGRVVFIGAAEFVGGRPDQVITLDELAAEFGSADARGTENLSAFHSSWQRLELVSNH